VLGVLVGLQTKPLNYSQAFIADYTRRYYNRSVTNTSLTNCVAHSLFLSTLLTVDYFRWRPTSHCRLSALVGSHKVGLDCIMPFRNSASLHSVEM
jgi:hypothetical protein